MDSLSSASSLPNAESKPSLSAAAHPSIVNITCPSCRSLVSMAVGTSECPSCKQTLTVRMPTKSSSDSYRELFALAVMVVIYRLAGLLIILGGVIASFAVPASYPNLLPFPQPVVFIAGITISILIGISFVATAEFIELILRIEKNTRR